MQLKFLSFIALSMITISLNAQFGMPAAVAGAEKDAKTNVAKVESEGIGSLISQFSGQLTPAALTDDFNKGKSAFESQTKSTNDVKSSSSSIQKLSSGIKPSAFSAGWAKIKDKWSAEIKSATTVKQLAGYLKTLSQNVDPKFLGPTWEKIKPTFNSALDKLAQ